MNTAKAMNTLSSAVKEIRDVSSETVSQIADTAVGATKQVTTTVDKSAHRSPWYFIGAAAAVAGAFGFVLGRKSKF